MSNLTTSTKVLVVDNEAIVAADVAKELRHLGYAIAGIATSGTIAVPLAAQTQPNLVLIDLMLSENMDGIKTAEQILQVVQCPVIYMASDADDATLNRAKFTQPQGYLMKPVQHQNLSMTIEIALQTYQREQQLQADLERERAANQAISQLLAVTAHDLKTPLTVVATTAELLETFSDRYTEAERQRYCCQIQIAIAQVNQMLEDSIILAQSNLGELKFDPQPLDLANFCYGIAEELQSIPGHTSPIVLSYQGNRECGTDFKLLRRILINLLSNALKYSPNGNAIHFTIACETDTVTFQIQDQGIGIPPEDLEQLFDRFFRARNVGSIDGTGLGLAIVKQCVELHQGQVEVQSQLDQGTTFIVTLPSVLKPIA